MSQHVVCHDYCGIPTSKFTKPQHLVKGNEYRSWGKVRCENIFVDDVIQ